MPRRRRGNPDICPVIFLCFLLLGMCVALQIINALVTSSVEQNSQYGRAHWSWRNGLQSRYSDGNYTDTTDNTLDIQHKQREHAILNSSRPIRHHIVRNTAGFSVTIQKEPLLEQVPTKLQKQKTNLATSDEQKKQTTQTLTKSTAVRETTEKLGLTVRQTTEKLGLPVRQTTEKLGLTVRQTTEKLGLTARQTTEKLGLPVRQTTEKLGLPVMQTTEKPGLQKQTALTSNGKNQELLAKLESDVNTLSATKKMNHEFVLNGLDRLRQFQLELPIPMVVNQQEALLYGHFRAYLGFLTIGLPSVSRKGISYLEETLDSLIKETSEEERTEVTVVVLLTDKEHDVILRRAKNLYADYKTHIDSGFIQIVHPHRHFYPDFNKLELTLNDSRARVEWRSKQNIDYAYLCFYAKNISEYYIQLEDDIFVRSGYIHSIKDAINFHYKRSKWFAIYFAKIGFIGRLMNSKDLQTLGNYLLLFFSEQPGDLLFNYLRLIKSQPKEINRRPSLFQHRGVVSSLEGKIQNNVDRHYGGSIELMLKRKQFHVLNPEAEIITTIHYHHSKYNMPEFAYDRSDRAFVGHNPHNRDNFTIVFHNAQNISRIFIKTGMKRNGNDYIHEGDVLVSSTEDSHTRCETLKEIGSFKHGVFDSNVVVDLKPLRNIYCIVIIVSKDQKEWLTIKEIAIFR